MFDALARIRELEDCLMEFAVLAEAENVDVTAKFSDLTHQSVMDRLRLKTLYCGHHLFIKAAQLTRDRREEIERTEQALCPTDSEAPQHQADIQGQS